jgi:hypothetical protein
MSTRSKFLAVIAAVCGTLASGGEAGSGQAILVQQCYRYRDLDPIDACSICMSRCLGEGYKCCIIVSG